MSGRGVSRDVQSIPPTMGGRGVSRDARTTNVRGLRDPGRTTEVRFENRPSVPTRNVSEVLEPIHQDPVYTDQVSIQPHVPMKPETKVRSKKERSTVVYESNSIPFTSILTPMTGLTATNSTNGSNIQFELVRDHVTGMNSLTWEPFKGIILGGRNRMSRGIAIY